MPDSKVVFFLVSFLTKVGTPTDFIEKPERVFRKDWYQTAGNCRVKIWD